MSGGPPTSPKRVRTGLLTTSVGGEVVLRRIRVRALDEPGVEAILEVGTLVLGSHDAADLRISDRSVSRYHLELALLGDGVRVRDLGSTNGSFVRDLRVESLVVMPPIEIRLGKARVELIREDQAVDTPPPARTSFGELEGDSTAMRRVFELLERAAEGRAPVVFEGPLGSGKTAAARALHAARFAPDVPQRTIDLGSVDAEVRLRDLGAQLLTGSLLLERVDECTAASATTLLGLLDARERGDLSFVVSSTCSSDLRRRVEVGALPRALYFHLAGVRVCMPPLAERSGDLPRLARVLAARCGAKDFRPSRAWLDEQRTRAWPGNVRELARAVEMELHRRMPPSTPPPPSAFSEQLAVAPFKDAKREIVNDFECRYVAELLERCDGNLSRAAEEAGIDRGHLARLAKRHGLR